MMSDLEREIAELQARHRNSDPYTLDDFAARFERPIQRVVRRALRAGAAGASPLARGILEQAATLRPFQTDKDSATAELARRIGMAMLAGPSAHRVEAHETVRAQFETTQIGR